MKRLLIPSFLLLLLSCSAEKKYKHVNNVADILENIQPAEQVQEIDPAIDNTIKGEKGTAIYLPANSLVLPDGSTPKGKVSITVKECYSAADFLSNRLSTTCDTSFLETGGMIYLSARADGQELKVAKDKSFVVAFPKKDVAKPMETFYGAKDKNGAVAWQQALVPVKGGTPIDTALYSDSSLYRDQFSMCGYITSCNDEEVDWRIAHPDSSLFTYIAKRFTVPDSLMARYRNQIQSSAMSIQVKSGKIVGVQFDSTNVPVAYKKWVTQFLKEAPPLSIRDNAECFTINEEYLWLNICSHLAFDTGRYKQRFNQKYEQYRTKAIAQVDPEELNYYMISSTQLGWINCDRFLDLPEKKVEYIVKVPQAENTRLQLVFSDIRSVMQGEQTKDGFVFRNVPLGRKVKIIAVAYHNGKPALSTVQTDIGESPFQLSGFKEFSLADLEKELAVL